MLRRIVLLSLLPVATALAQDPRPVTPAGMREPIASVSGSASSDVKFTPDRARVQLSVQTRATTAAAAASDNATRQSAVISALRSLGIANEQLGTTGYNVNPEYRYDQNKPPVVVAYVVTNSIVADVHDLKLIGKVLDVAIASGANMVSSLDFYASNTDASRQQAISAAVVRARAEADVAARAAGGSIGELISLNIGGGNSTPPPRPMFAMQTLASSKSMDTPINPGEQTLSVSVFVKWRFLPGK